ncbi:hypothetical protein FJZ31_20735 [Candidatus Poribacteria bacterium]|nr:hypothetical protein [Candidatus Poribacteria bacterium]
MIFPIKAHPQQNAESNDPKYLYDRGKQSLEGLTGFGGATYLQLEQWLHSEEPDRISTMKEKEIMEMEKLKVLKAIAGMGLASTYDIYLSSFITLHRIGEIMQNLTSHNFIKKEKEYILDGDKVDYYSLTKKGKKSMAELEHALS